jgi:hypothetical protein
MSRTITIPTESVVTYNKDGIIKVEHLKKTKILINQQVAEAFLRLMGTTAEEAVEVLTTK